MIFLYGCGHSSHFDRPRCPDCGHLRSPEDAGDEGTVRVTVPKASFVFNRHHGPKIAGAIFEPLAQVEERVLAPARTWPLHPTARRGTADLLRELREVMP